MAKRARGSTTRPGQRARIQRAATRPVETTSTPPVRPTTLTPEEEARAAELEAQIVAEEKAAETAASKRDRARRGSAEPVVRSGSIASRASVEYAYVMRDVRRIAIIGGGLIAVLIGLWAVLTATGAGPL